MRCSYAKFETNSRRHTRLASSSATWAPWRAEIRPLLPSPKRSRTSNRFATFKGRRRRPSAIIQRTRILNVCICFSTHFCKRSRPLSKRQRIPEDMRRDPSNFKLDLANSCPLRVILHNTPQTKAFAIARGKSIHVDQCRVGGGRGTARPVRCGGSFAIEDVGLVYVYG